MNLNSPYVLGLQFISTSTTSSLSSTTIDAYKPFPYYSLETVQWSLLFGISFLLGIGMGANDVADAFGTSVGTGTVTVTQAFILATVVEMMGSVASGFGDNSQKALQVIETSMYYDNPEELVIGHIAMLVGCSVWLIIATFYSMPVSSIHSLLGATMGFSFVLKGFEGIVWERVGVIVAVWILSPVASALATLVTFFLLDVCILRRKDPVKTGLFYLPVIYLVVVFINVLLFMQDGSRVIRLDEVPFMYTVSVSLMFGVIAGFFALFVVGPVMKRRLKKIDKELPRIASSLSYSFPIRPKNWIRRAVFWAFPPLRKDDQKAVRLFSFLQVLTACFAGFAHGANDVSNSVAPLKDLVSMYNQQYNDDNTHINASLHRYNYYDLKGRPLQPIFCDNGNISVYVGLLSTLAVLLGIWILGIRVVRTVGEELSKMNPATGFSMEFGAAIVALATNAYNIPASMTHCLVGSIFGLGLVRSGPILKWKMVKYVFLSWVLTIPMSGLISAAVMYTLQTILRATDLD